MFNQLQQQVNLLTNIMETSPVGIMIHNANGQVTLMNNYGKKILGFSPEEIKFPYDNLFLKIIDHHGNLLKKEDLVFAKVKATKEAVYNVPIGIIKTNGNQVLLNVNASPLFDEKNNFNGVTVVFEDVTEQVRIKAELQKSEARFRNAFEYAPLAMFLVSLEGKILAFNLSALELFGYSESELLTLNIDQIKQDKEIKNKNQYIKILISGKVKYYQTINHYLTKDEKLITALISISLVRDEQEKPLYFIKQIQDITARQEAEKVKDQLMLRNQSMIQALGDIVYEYSVRKNIINWEGEYIKVLGYSSLEIGNKIQIHLRRIHPEDRQKVVQEFKRAFQEDKIFDLEYRLLCQNNSYCWVHDRGIMHGEKKGKPEQIIGVIKNINEKKKIEIELLESEQKLNSFVQTVGTVIMVISPDYKILEWNQEAEKIYGYKRDEVIGENYSILFLNPQDRQAYQEKLQEAFMGKEIRNFESKILTYNGEEKYLLWNINILKSYEGKSLGVIAVGQDITQQKQIENSLSKSEQNFRTLAEFTTDWEYWMTPNQKIVYMSPSCEDLTGYQAEEFINDPQFFQKIIYQEDRVLWDKHFCRYFEVVASELEFRIVTKQGEIRWLSHICRSIYNEDGDWLGKRVSNRDITDQKKAQFALEESENRYRQMVETISEGIWIIDPENKTTFVNEIMANMLGYSVEEMIGKELFDFMDEQGKKLALLNIERRRQGIFEQHDFLFLRKDQTPLWVNISTSPILDELGNYQGALGLLTDITKRKNAELVIQNALKKEQELNEFKNRFISMTSHEFRTPLSVISSSASILKNFSHKLSEEKKQKHLDIIETYVKYTTQLLDDILLISRAESGKLEFNPEPINIVQFCQDITEEMRINALNHQLNFNYQCNFCDNIYQLDPKLLRHIFINLLSNAFKYSPENSQVDFQLIIEENQLIFQIKDQGIGIPIEDQDQLFEPFHRASNIGTIKGTGLGLNIVKKSIELHGGKINFVSKINQGTTFTVIIPIN